MAAVLDPLGVSTLQKMNENQQLATSSIIDDQSEKLSESKYTNGQAVEPAAQTEIKETAASGINGHAAELIPQPAQSSTVAPDAPVDGIQKVVFMQPSQSSKLPTPTALTTEQTTAYNTLLSIVSQWTTIPTTSATNSPTEPITDAERMWLTRECLLRYLRATKWILKDAATRLRSTLVWRREYLSQCTDEHVSIENETGKQLILGYDIAGRSCMYLNPGRQNTARSDRQIQHLAFMLERNIDLMPAGVETLALLINLSETSNGQTPTYRQGTQFLHIVQNHYPERLGRALIIKAPWFFWGFYKLIGPFIDPVTREKIKFNEDLRNHVPPQQLLKAFGGEITFEYDHNVYWPFLVKVAAERRKTWEERWVRGGKMVGELEMYLRGGQEESLKDLEVKKVNELADGVGALKTEK